MSHPDYLDEALNEAFELRDTLEENTHSTSPQVSFILKASILDKASELFMFSRQSELEEFFARKSEDEDDDISNVREWAIQRYLNNPKLLPNYGNRKFHLRVYVVAQSNLRVYVYDGILALFASLPYQYDGENYDRLRHITNTCAQTDSNVDESELVKEFWTLEGLDKEKIFEQIKMITQEIFTGLHHETPIFQPLKNAFEIYGFDFLINENDQVYFLEANAYPDFKQTGSTLSILIKELFENVVQEIILPYFHSQSTTSKSIQRQLHLVYEKQKSF